MDQLNFSEYQKKAWKAIINNFLKVVYVRRECRNVQMIRLLMQQFNIEDIIDHFIVYILNTMEISWRSKASPQTSNLEKKEVKYTEIDDLAYH